MNEQIYNWLKEFPGLELLQRQQVDAVPGGCGLFFLGSKISAREPNLIGGGRCQKRLTFRIRRYGDPIDSPVLFLMLGARMEANPPMGTAELKNARCIRDEGYGLALWEADAEFTFWEDL